jgi:hypothetical protein
MLELCAYEWLWARSEGRVKPSLKAIVKAAHPKTQVAGIFLARRALAVADPGDAPQ